MYKTTIFFIEVAALFALFSLIFKGSPHIKRIKTKSFVPFGYKLFYTDQKTENRKEDVIYSKLLYSEKYNLQGKPDYIFKKGNKYVPIELKSGKIKEGETAHKGDLLQLAAYFLIIEDLYGKKVKYGKLVYPNYTFIIKNRNKLKRELLKTISQMQNMLKTGSATPNCSFQTCKHCICKLTVCEHYKNDI